MKTVAILAALLAASCSARSPRGESRSATGAEPSIDRGAVEQGAARTVTIRGKEYLVHSEESASFCFVEPTPELKARLSPEQWEVLVNAATEPPFRNKYWNNHEPGVYVDAIDGTPLFASLAKFDSGTGWPSFFEPIDEGALVLIEDRSFGMMRIEVRAKASGGHLGHVFDDGPPPSGLRYCINSASLRFVHRDELEKAGYGALLSKFETGS